MPLGKEQITNYQQKPLEVAIEALGETIYIRKVTVDDREEVLRLMHESKAEKNTEDVSARDLEVLTIALADESGDRLFSKDEVGSLGRIPTAAVSQIVDEFLKHNGMTADAAEELKGNSSGPAPNEDSSSV